MNIPPTVRGRETRARLLDVSERVFGEMSFFRVTIADLTQAAGVGQGTFYLYFPSKEAVFQELVRSHAQEVSAVIQHAMEGSRDRVAASRAGLEAFLGYSDQHRTLCQIIRQAEFVDPTLFHDYYAGLASAYSAALQASPGTDNSTNSDPTALAHCVIGVADAMTMRWPDTGLAEEARETGLRFVENGVRGAATPKQKKGKKRDREGKPAKHVNT